MKETNVKHTHTFLTALLLAPPVCLSSAPAPRVQSDGKPWGINRATVMHPTILSLVVAFCFGAFPVLAALPPERAGNLSEARCDEFQFAASVPFVNSQGKEQTTTAYLWIPETCVRVRGIVLTQHNIAEQPFTENAALRQVCHHNNMAVVWFFPAFAPTFEKPEVEGRILLKALEELAKTSGYEEVAKAPWLTFGHSTMGNFVQNLANWKPERTIAQIVFKSSFNTALPNNKAVPLLYVGNNFVEWSQTKKDLRAPGYAKYFYHLAKDREQNGRPLSGFLECGSSHFNLSGAEAAFIASYVDKSAKARLPEKEGDPLKPIPPDSGWLVTMDFKTPAQPSFSCTAMKDAKSDARKGFWFFDEELAKAFIKAEDVDWGRKPQIPIVLLPNGKEAPFVDSGIMSVDVELATDGTVALRPAFMSKIPTNFTVAAGEALGHSKTNEVALSPIAGNVVKSPDGKLRLTLDRRMSWWGTHLQVTAPGDSEYRPAAQVVALEILTPLSKGTAQQITFDPIPAPKPGMKSVELSAKSDAGLPVEFVVIHGPATVSGKTLTFTQIPPRSKLPVAVKVMAYSLGRRTEPAIKQGGWVFQTVNIGGK